MDLAVPVDHRRQIKERETLPVNEKMLLKIRVMLIPIVSGALGTVPKGWERELQELEIAKRVGTI